MYICYEKLSQKYLLLEIIIILQQTAKGMTYTLKIKMQNLRQFIWIYPQTIGSDYDKLSAHILSESYRKQNTFSEVKFNWL